MSSLESTEDRSMDINVTELKKKQKISGPYDAINLILGHWEKKRLENYKEAKAIFVDKDGMAFAICDIPTENHNVPIETLGHVAINAKSVLDKAKERKAASVIIAESRVPSQIMADKYRVKLATSLQVLGKRRQLRIQDILSIYSTASSSLQLQGLMPAYQQKRKAFKTLSSKSVSSEFQEQKTKVTSSENSSTRSTRAKRHSMHKRQGYKLV